MGEITPFVPPIAEFILVICDFNAEQLISASGLPVALCKTQS
jgi:hypothetical protein